MHHTQYTTCICHGWLRLDRPHITATVNNKTVFIHDDACLRVLMKCERVTNIKRILEPVSSFPVMG